MTDFIRFHQYTDSQTGHVNVEFFRDGASLGFYGANQDGFNANGLKGGVFIETTDSEERIIRNPNSHFYTDITVSRSQLDNAHSYAQSQADLTEKGNSNYDLICNNCVDFAGSVLEKIGRSKDSIADFLADGTATDWYANTVLLDCEPYDDPNWWSITWQDVWYQGDSYLPQGSVSVNPLISEDQDGTEYNQDGTSYQ